MIACIDIGGTAIKAGVMDKEGNLGQKTSLPVANDNFEELKNTIVTWVKSLEDIEGLAISSPGAVDVETGIVGGASAVPCIHGPNVKEILSKELDMPVAIENDANCAALAEVFSGAAKDNTDVCFVVIGSGIGGCVIKDRKIHRGNHIFAGEFGYMLLEDKGESHLRILSELCATQALVRNVAKRMEGDWNGLKVFEEAEKGNEICKEEIKKFYHYLAMAMFNLQHIYDPEKIIIGGAISKREDLCDKIGDAIDDLRSRIKIDSLKPVLVPCVYHGDANLLGAYANYQIQVK